MYVDVNIKKNIDLSIRNSSRQKVSSHGMDMHSARANNVRDSWLERAPRIYIAGHTLFKFHNKNETVCDTYIPQRTVLSLIECLI
jgi:hypothetical protein